jgi:hypothetical protein
MKKVISGMSVLCFVSFISIFAQKAEWSDHLPYAKTISVAECDHKIYCATPYSMFYYNKDDHSVNRLSKVNGLSDVGINVIAYNSTYNTLLVAYSNANIDLIKDDSIINFSGIKQMQIIGNKTINNILFIDSLAFLSCGFGIVSLNIDKVKIRDTIYIGKNGSKINVLALTKDFNDSLFAATEKGIYKSYSKDPNLSNYTSWHIDKRIDTTATFNAITHFAEQVVVNKRNAYSMNDTLYRYTNGQWNAWSQNDSFMVRNIRNCYDKLVVVNDNFVRYYDTTFNLIHKIYTYYLGSPYPNDAIIDKDQFVWIADNYSGLVAFNPSPPPGLFSFIKVAGPLTASAFSMCANGNDLYIVPGERNGSYIPSYIKGQVYHFDNAQWFNMSEWNDTLLSNVHDLVTVTVDPSDNKSVYAGSWGCGLVEFDNGVVKEIYNETNSTLRHHSLSNATDVRVGGTAFDKVGNLWVVNTHNDNCLSRKNGNMWTGYLIPIANESDLGQLMIDKNDQKWIQKRHTTANPGSIIVFTDNQTPINPDDDYSKILDSSLGNGNLNGNYVLAMMEDLLGHIWVGTENGINIFYKPENILTTGDTAIHLPLLESETVTAIEIDGNNRKWIGTENNGLFLLSADGTVQLCHFTFDNSPLFSNRISSLAINPLTNELFIGTDKGIISFRGIINSIDPLSESQKIRDIKTFPNPSNEYLSVAFFLEQSSDVKIFITDVSGKVIQKEYFKGNVGDNIKTIYLGNLNKGIYLVNIRTCHNTMYKKIIKL